MPFGVYVHIPFCARRCDYCAFAVWTDRASLMSSYVDACRREVLASSMPIATSVYVGGGTPSLLPGDLLASLLDGIARVEGAEVTVECNPEDASAALFDAWQRAGVTRVSFGVQSMVPAALSELTRRHTPADVGAAVALARAAGFETFGVDLIYGARGESPDDWRRTVEAVIALDPPHVSAYGLTVEPGTALWRAPGRWPDDDDQASKYLLADELLSEAGLGWYEVSNWARPGHECRHNRLYWAQGDYRGIGCAAHSHFAGRRWWNVRTPERYIALVGAGRSPEAAGESLSEDSRRFEGLALSLRTREGVPAGTLPVDELADLVSVSGMRASLTARGRLLANEVSLRLQ